jgi:hypothetical protein
MGHFRVTWRSPVMLGFKVEVLGFKCDDNKTVKGIPGDCELHASYVRLLSLSLPGIYLMSRVVLRIDVFSGR